MSDPRTPVRRTAWPEVARDALATPLQMSTVYQAQTPDQLDAQYEGDRDGFTYSREGHPNARVLAQKIDAMEGVTWDHTGVMTGSGMGAVGVAMLALAKAGDHILGGNQLYGRSLRLMTQDLPRLGFETSLCDPTDAASIASEIRPNTRLILVEVVSNPTLRVADMEAIYKAAREVGALVVVDNTFTTPRAYKPFAEGADVVLHSVTKLLAGHSDAMLGYITARDAAYHKAIFDAAVTWGFAPSPFDCWMAERGLYSFELRFDAAQARAKALAYWLQDQPHVERVVYPGLADHPDHNRAGVLLGDRTGNMVSFAIKGGREEANVFTKAIAPMAFAPTLGDVATTVSHAASSSHRGLTPEGRAALGITEGFFRVSVGIEPLEVLTEGFGAGFAAL